MAAKRKTPFTKVILNVPTSLLEKFDFAAKTNDYSRSEAVKEAMRNFVIVDFLFSQILIPSLGLLYLILYEITFNSSAFKKNIIGIMKKSFFIN